ncbi:hypothetical protein BLNAU_3507 [Blattamonas nauphoetae]|uniref:Tetratricopeptide repeat protein n=1 Tax=Blattamonas nauphoetae TaxID=2049346 RepID=A0ABQ9YCJ5_9EUKA|nr:hypothetical protein BLNAU_3507 [Blattamonas nauphoetae]
MAKKDRSKKKRSIPSLDDIAEIAVTDPELAVNLLMEMDKNHPDNCQVMDMLAELLINEQVVGYHGDLAIDKAGALLQRSIELQPQQNPIRYFNLAMITPNQQEAMELYNTGIRIAEAEGQAAQLVQDSDRVNQLKNEIVQARVSQADLILLMDLPQTEAFHQAHSFISMALELIPNDRRALQNRASLLMTEMRQLDASLRDPSLSPTEQEQRRANIQTLFQNCQAAITSSVQQWIPLLDSPVFDDEDELPSPSERLIASQLLVDLRLSQHALPILQQLISVDDENFDVCYLISLAYADQGDMTQGIIHAHQAHLLYQKENEESQALIQEQLFRFADYYQLTQMEEPVEPDESSDDGKMQIDD